jgi:hypothetical protein
MPPVMIKPLLTSLADTVRCVPGKDFAGQVISIFKFPTWYQYLNCETVAGHLTPKVVFPDSIYKILLAVIEIMLRIAALLAVGFVIYGGFRFILSQGEPEQANSARSTVINALIGLVIAVMATAIVSFVFSNLAKY